MQYVFIYQALLEHYLYGDTELEVTSLETHLQKIYNKIPGTSNNGLEEEFKVSWSKTTSFRWRDHVIWGIGDVRLSVNLPTSSKSSFEACEWLRRWVPGPLLIPCHSQPILLVRITGGGVD